MAIGSKPAIPILVLCVLILAGGVYALYSSYDKAANKGFGDPTTTVDFTIEEGQSIDEITHDLLEKGLITNEYFFQIYVRQRDVADQLQAGSFKVPNNLSLKDLVDILQHAVFPDIWVTIPEGLRATEIADILDDGFSGYEETSFSKDEFLVLVETPTLPSDFDNPAPAGTTLEGYLFPDTYRFPPDATAEYVVLTMLTTFNEKIVRPNRVDIEALSSKYTLHELVILASILERETRHQTDRPIVADILLRRLDNGWGLEVDVTLLYYFGDWKHELTFEELQLETPYNTRKSVGLPPTPISNPGAQSFGAVLNPEANDYWFFISDNDGILHYARTLEEHNRNISLYLQ
jgi:UPF0755 protein